MSTPRDVAVLVGSLRKDSFSRKLALALAAMAPAGIKLEIVEIGQLPLYNQDEDASPPASWVAFRDRIRRADAVLFVTPEYNRSVPAALKNAIDVGSRPYGQSAWNGKPGGVVSASPGAVGGFGANHHLRQSLVFLNIPVLQQPEAYISGVDKLLDEHGGIASESTRGFLGTYLSAFAAWIERNAPR
ncbi:NAD(P)H-dependent oxidoreductase [Cupriavidus basilensis]|uniref:NAD(P)H-dependent oxidoreductase n=1 Tax=Cupriavidus basilensis TaxID=68895 RepID=A0ABT6B3T6_9BURK|nr:NAD(P)H-dependent oxidoreductase [Cupriavidus basilensis]MDF3839528.1 NAD(P)H-dependent oxidoreductase [Cupriavidus basilensis]